MMLKFRETTGCAVLSVRTPNKVEKHFCGECHEYAYFWLPTPSARKNMTAVNFS